MTAISAEPAAGPRTNRHCRLRDAVFDRKRRSLPDCPALALGQPGLRLWPPCGTLRASRCSGRWCPGRPWPAGPACRALPGSWTRSRPPSIAGRRSAGWTTTTPGWPPSGGIRLTISAGILAAADWLCRRRWAVGKPPLRARDLLTAAIKAYEIQGCSRSRTRSTALGSTT